MKIHLESMKTQRDKKSHIQQLDTKMMTQINGTYIRGNVGKGTYYYKEMYQVCSMHKIVKSC